jgi:hypothetical protein
MSPLVDIDGSWLYEDESEASRRRETLLSDDGKLLAVVRELDSLVVRVEFLERGRDPGLEGTYWEVSDRSLLQSLAEGVSFALDRLNARGRGGAA